MKLSGGAAVYPDMKTWIVLGALVVWAIGCGGSVGSTSPVMGSEPVEPTIEPTAIDAGAETSEDVQDVQIDADAGANALEPCAEACTDFTAPCGCSQGVCTFRNYDGATTRTCLERH